MIAQKDTPIAAMRKRGAQQLLPLSCLLASLPVLAAEQPKELPKASETMVVTGTAMKVEVPMAETPRAVSVVNREDLDLHAVQQLGYVDSLLEGQEALTHLYRALFGKGALFAPL